MGSSLASVIPLVAESGGSGFPAPTVQESFFFDAWGNGSIIASWKVAALCVIGTAILIAFFLTAARRATIVPGKFQFFAEGMYGFVKNSVVYEVMGRAGRSWTPFLATMFMFILLMNIYEIIPFAMIPVTSHFIYPAALALLTWVLYNFVGIKRFGVFGYLKNQCVVPKIPWPMHFLLIPLEFVSRIVFQPFTLAIRLFANMFAGHMLVIIAGAGTVYFLESGGFDYVYAVLPFLASVALWFFELLICALQAYVFVLLTAIYIQAAMEEEH